MPKLKQQPDKALLRFYLRGGQIAELYCKEYTFNFSDVDGSLINYEYSGGDRKLCLKMEDVSLVEIFPIGYTQLPPV